MLHIKSEIMDVAQTIMVDDLACLINKINILIQYLKKVTISHAEVAEVLKSHGGTTLLQRGVADPRHVLEEINQ
ncbi:hypothetical protein SARC_09375 [Sphaeroforma arctica JP610]|uniref:Uncharacterized protein n=1 Tax=Sphaeroforma arctica JP610 TaxID=667725 RepID=A0A0L0FN46_9EUKA|nr:hypothetical protein SARC_09375 [Sphaeroforma arctica JP610]KNC78192.1 hypothetical protein SARC_09375 [Sphaeroforma arctica JP610]|eukprot:XP_014152094.1 hypothetical protein SARC_09375 [Sphaeroforma arctica JP610]